MTASPLETLAAAESALAALNPLPWHLPLGPMAPLVAGAILGAGRGTWVCCGPRERVALALRGCSAERLVDPRAGARPYKLAPSSGAPGNRALHAVGLALASRQPVLCLLGDASGANGAFYEALNLASLTRAPVVFVLLEHGLGAGAPVGPQRAGDALALAGALGLSARAAAPELEALREAVAAAVALGASALVHSRLPR